MMIEKDARKTETVGSGSSEWDELAQMGDKETVGTSWDDLAGAESAVEGQRQDREEEVPEELRHGTETLTETELDEIRRQTEEGRQEWTKNRRAEQAAERRERMLETLKNVGRKVLDIVGISMIAGTFAEARKRREREALQRTLQGKTGEQPQGEEAWGGALNDEAEEARRRQSEEALRQAEEWEQRHDEASLRDLTDEAWNRWEDNVRSKQKFEQRQMEMEQDLNDRLTGMEEIAAAESGTQADARTMEYGGKEISVYDMKGYPVTILSHDIGYKTGGGEIVGSGTAKGLLENPGMWLEEQTTKDMYEEQAMASGTTQRGNTLSTSYFNTETMSKLHSGKLMNNMLETGSVRYGFDHVRPTTLVRVRVEDAATPRYIKQDEMYKQGLLGASFDSLEHPPEDRNTQYNEVAMMRYDDEGKPMKPDYLVVMDGKITDNTLKHAAFFGVPIVNVESRYYRGWGQNDWRKEKAEAESEENNKESTAA